MHYIRRLRLHNFRSYKQLEVDFDSRPVVLVGENGAGKTNLLEAISLLAIGRGLRGVKNDALAYRPGAIEQDWGVGVEWMMQDGDRHEVIPINIGYAADNPHRRILKIDGQKASGSQLATRIRMLWLTPAQDRLFMGPASERRRFLDRLTLAHQADHGRHSLLYEKARSERNRLLMEGITDQTWFRVLEARLAKYGAQIAVARAMTIHYLQAEMDKSCFSHFPKANLHLDGEAEEKALAGEALTDIEAFIYESLGQNRPLDARAGRSLRGVHQSDLQVSFQASNRPAYECSTGEQKALLICLILAHARAQAMHHPVILLDEVVAHLDASRRLALIEELSALESQIFMSGTDMKLFKSFSERALFLQIADGQLTEA